jgi:hypothetical protein
MTVDVNILLESAIIGIIIFVALKLAVFHHKYNSSLSPDERRKQEAELRDWSSW